MLSAADAPSEDVPACEPSSEQPRPRGDSAGAVDPVTGAFYLFGGDVGPVVSCMARPAFDDETWRFDPRCKPLDAPHPNVCPSARSAPPTPSTPADAACWSSAADPAPEPPGAYTVYRGSGPRSR
ncbi:MAG: hypothetical protein IPF99_20920 [Deltaproteobacteria bacterium]|nr:hypothetical protein [Deltaproteobacteria bacterium]